MNCAHCGQEHPDNFQFCPMTGQRLTPRFKACINGQCPDYGKYILPLESRFCPSCGHPLEQQVDDSKKKLEFTVYDVSFNMILVEHGDFMMGATEEQEHSRPDERPVHKVVITNDYYIGETQVTQALWAAITGNNPSSFKGGYRPVERVSWYECLSFIRTLNRKLRAELAGKKFRLPTEAEWEFAARGGNKSENYLYAGSDILKEVAWFRDNSNGKTRPVAEKKPNELGIYDMSGNVSEWCYDKYRNYFGGTEENPAYWTSLGVFCVYRGGSLGDVASDLRTSCRGYISPQSTSTFIGFRLVLS